MSGTCYLKKPTKKTTTLKQDKSIEAARTWTPEIMFSSNSSLETAADLHCTLRSGLQEATHAHVERFIHTLQEIGLSKYFN